MHGKIGTSAIGLVFQALLRRTTEAVKPAALTDEQVCILPVENWEENS